MSKFLTILATISLVCSFAATAGAAETITVGCNAEFPPFELTDDGNNIIGFDIDILTAAGKAAGFGIVMRDQLFDTLIGAVESGELDAVISAMTITDARREKVDFSDSYFNASQVLVVREESTDIKTLDDIKTGRKVGVQTGTTCEALAEEAMGADNPNLFRYAKCNEEFNNLMLGELDAVVVELPVAQTYVRILPGLMIGSEALSDEHYGVAVKKGNKALLDKINAGLKAVKESGEYDAITEKWFADGGA